MPQWIMRYLFGIKSLGGASAMRGIALEHVLSEKYQKKTSNVDEVDNRFMGLCGEAGIDLHDTRTEKERKALPNFWQVLDANFNYRKMESYKEKVEVKLDDLPVPIIGFVDFLFKDKIVDLKTTTRMPSKPTEAQKRQMALYSLAYPKKSVHLFFASPKEHRKFILKSP